MRRALLIGLIAASIIMVTAYSREGSTGPLHTLQSAVSGAVSPLRIVGGSVEAATSTVGDTMENITADQNTLTGLREYNSQLEQQYAQMEEYKQETQRLQKLLDLKDNYQIEGTGARVIGRSSEAWSQTVIINKGTNEGISTGQTVIGTSGVVGQVVSASGSTATVRLLTDPQSGAAAMVQSSRAEGILRGSLIGLLYLEDLDADAEVNVGDVIVTSGLGGSYARGLIIGTVVKVDAQQGDTSRRIVVSPNDSIDTLEDVLVVSSVGASDDDDSDSSGSSSSSASANGSSSSSSSSSSSDSSGNGNSSNEGGTRAMGEKNNLVLVVGADRGVRSPDRPGPGRGAVLGAAELPAGLCAGGGHRASPPRPVRCCRLSWACCTTSRARARWAAWRFCWSSYVFWPLACSLCMDNDTLFMPLAIFTACALLAELSYGMLLMACGLAANPLEALFYTAPFRARCTTAPWAWWSTSSWRGCLPVARQDRGLRTPKLR